MKSDPASPVSTDMWHQKALRLIPVTFSYILMLVLTLSEPTCGGSVSNNFHKSNCTDQSGALGVCHRCVTPAHCKCCRAAVTSEIDDFDDFVEEK